MDTLITILHVVVSLILVLTVLLQSGKGGMGAAFGGGSSTGAVFGGSGAGGFLRKITVGAAVIFMLTSMTLAWLASNTGTDALKRYSAQQRRAKQLKDAAKKDALEGADSTDAGAAQPGDETGDDTGASMSTPDEAGDTKPEAGDTKPSGDKPGDTKPSGEAPPKPAPKTTAPKTGPPQGAATKKPAAPAVKKAPAKKPAIKKPAAKPAPAKKPAAKKPAAKKPAPSAPAPK